MYSLSGYAAMLKDRVRVQAYASAMQSAITRDSVVLDIGSGPGYFALLAARQGARRVYAIEPSNVIQIGRQAARDHGLDDRIEFIQGLSTETDLPEPADVVVSDLRGIVPLFGDHLPSIIDARERLLAPGGVLLPARDHIYLAPVEAPALYRQGEQPWLTNVHDLSMQEGWRLWVNSPSKQYLEETNLLAPPLLWETLDYAALTETRRFGQPLAFDVGTPGTVHGLLLWFDTELIQDVGFSNRPGTGDKLYGQLFFPLENPLSLGAGTRLDCRLNARCIDNDLFWTWHATVGDQASSPQQQSNFQGMPLTRHALDSISD